jgi:hypothetical protein
MFNTPSTFDLSPSRWNSTTGLCGAAIWAVFAGLAGLGRTPFGIIELLFLFAALVIVPLGLELTDLVSPGIRSVFLHPLQAIAMLAVSTAFWLPPGHNAVVLSVPWLAFCVALASARYAHRRNRSRSTHSLVIDVGHADLVLGAAWLVASRAGVRPMGFQEPIILLTAVHLHYSGFAAALIAAATWNELESKRLRMPGLPMLVWLVALLPFVLAAGFVFSPALRFAAAVSLSACVTALALILWWVARDWSTTPRIYLRAASLAAVSAFSLAGLYAFSEYFDRDWITIPGMSNSHGLLNGMGFVLLGLLGWVLERHGRMEKQEPAVELHAETQQRSRATAVLARAGAKLAGLRKPHGATAPDFLARDYYDR